MSPDSEGLLRKNPEAYFTSETYKVKDEDISTAIIKEMEWSVNDTLKIDIIKNGMDRSLIISKEKDKYTN